MEERLRRTAFLREWSFSLIVAVGGGGGGWWREGGSAGMDGCQLAGGDGDGSRPQFECAEYRCREGPSLAHSRRESLHFHTSGSRAGKETAVCLAQATGLKLLAPLVTSARCEYA